MFSRPNNGISGMGRNRTKQLKSADNAKVTEVASNSPVLRGESECTAKASKTRDITPVPQRGAEGRWLQGSPSPNPAGRPCVPAEVKEAARAHTVAAIETLARVMADESAPPSAQVMAATAMLNRGWGKPTVSVEAKVATVDMSKAHLDALQRLHRRQGSIVQIGRTGQKDATDL